MPSTREWFERGGEVAETGERLALADVRLRAPITPKKFFHTAGNFAAHHEELAAVDWSHPVHKGIVFFQNVDAIVGPEDDIVYPEGLTKELDYELELAIVVGRTGKWFDADEAAERYVAGYTVFNDITARDIQRREMQSGVFSFSKGIDTFCPIGPWIVTADEIPDPQALAMELRVNGEVRQRGNTDDMLISIPHLVAYHSPQGYSAGDLITTGTISGVAAIQPNPFDFYLQPGDVVEAEIADVGLLRNTIVPWSAAHDTAAVRDGPVRVKLGTLRGRAVEIDGDRARDLGPSLRDRARPAATLSRSRGDWFRLRPRRPGGAGPRPAAGVRDRAQLRAACGRGRLHAARAPARLHQVPVLHHRPGHHGRAAGRQRGLGDRGRRRRGQGRSAHRRGRRVGRARRRHAAARTCPSGCFSSAEGRRSSRSASRTAGSDRPGPGS